MFQLSELPFSYDSLEPFIDEETMRVHHDGHHATYVKNLNEALSGQDKFLNMDVEKLLKSLDQVPEEIWVKVKNNAGGHFHHSLFWTLLKKDGGQPSGKLLEDIIGTFGSFEEFKGKFDVSASAVFGSGWAWLVLENGNLKIINTPNQDSPVSLGLSPILTLDLWEHAYYLKYKNKRADYIQNFWNIINWEEIGKRYQNASVGTP